MSDNPNIFRDVLRYIDDEINTVSSYEDLGGLSIHRLLQDLHAFREAIETMRHASSPYMSKPTFLEDDLQRREMLLRTISRIAVMIGVRKSDEVKLWG